MASVIIDIITKGLTNRNKNTCNAKEKAMSDHTIEVKKVRKSGEVFSVEFVVAFTKEKATREARMIVREHAVSDENVTKTQTSDNSEQWTFEVHTTELWHGSECHCMSKK